MNKKIILFTLVATSILSSCNNTKSNNEANADSFADSTSVADSANQESTNEDTSIEPRDEEMESQRGNYDIRDVARLWKKRTIKVVDGTEKTDIVTLFTAFNNEWPTYVGNTVVKKANPKAIVSDGYDNMKVTIDPKNGYLELPMQGDGETMSSCVWRRKNGHSLFAVCLAWPTAGVGEHVFFYDYDPTKKTLTPEDSPVLESHLLEKEGLHFYTLPQTGKTMTVQEENNLGTILVYNFDGQNLKLAGYQLQWLKNMEEQYRQDDTSDVHGDFTKFAFIDIDQDGVDEVWLRASDNESGAIYWFSEGTPVLLIVETDRFRPSFAKGAVSVSGAAGGPSFYTHIMTMSEGEVRHEVNCSQVYEEEDYEIDGKSVSVSEGKKFIKKLGEWKEISPKWHKICR